MKKFQCVVCNYIHEGDTPPETCPICGATKDKFFEYSDNKQENDIKKNDQLEEQEYDVVVVGSGASGLTAAICAHAKGLKVVVLEKASKVGGTSARSGGRYWVPNNKQQKELGISDNKEDCLKYMLRYAYPTKFDENKEFYGVTKVEYELLETYYENASPTFDYLEELGIMESVFEFSWKQKPQVDYMDHLVENKGIRGRTLMPKTDAGPAVSGFDLINILLEYLNKNKVEIVTNCYVEDIIKNDLNEVVGVKTNNKTQVSFYAKKGVIFGSGGFSHNEDLMMRFQTPQHYGGCAVPENVGDLVNIAEKNGLKLGNMNNAFRAQSMVEMYIDNPSGSSNVFYIIGDSIMQVNKYGKRVINEKRNYTDRTMAHFRWDENNAEYPNSLMFLIFDQRTAQLWQGFPPLPVGDTMAASYIISGNSLAELEENISKKLEQIALHVSNIKLDESFLSNLNQTVERFNKFALSGIDEDFARGATDYDQEFTTFPPTIPDVQWPPVDSKNPSMYPLSDEGPYYAIILGAGTLDTNGGPLINKHAQMIDYKNDPVVGLYGAGNCISAIGKNAYWGAGSTLGPGMTYAHIAVEHLLKQKDNFR